MNMLKDRHVLVLGLGQSGLAMAQWCARSGARLTVVDTRAQPPQLAALRERVPQAEFVCRAMDATLLDDASIRLIARSPGLMPADLAALETVARERALPVLGELDFFVRALADLKAARAYAPQVVAITGSNGKTTVTALTGQLLERAGKSVAVAGNIGPSLLEALQARLDADDLPEIWVLELSSFQLADVSGFEPTVATVLNLSQDHLDWHGDMAAYAVAKARVFGDSSVMVLNRDDTVVMAMRPQPITRSTKAGKGEKTPDRTVITFGADAPQHAGDFGIEDDGVMAWLAHAVPADEGGRKRRGEAPEWHLQRLMPMGALRIRGRHNALNALAALALASRCGCSLAPMLYGLREYRGESHRMQSVGVVDGVEYFDDSKGTNVGATVAALHGLGPEHRVVAILGGDGKNQDFSPLVEPVRRHARAVVLIGRDAPVIERALISADVPLHHAQTLPDAVQQARGLAQSGDVVLLSPACASLDMFTSYLERSAVFCQAVRDLALDAGVDLEVPA